jgi:hypothetical protein
MRSAVLSLFTVALAAATATAQPVESPITADVLTDAPVRSGPALWGTAEYLLWWNTPMNSPDLIQSVPAAVARQSLNTGTPLPAGATTRVFPKARQLDFGAMSGVRAFVGGYTADGEWGLDGGFFALEKQVEQASPFNAGLPVAIARQYVNVADGTPTALYSSLFPDYVGGVAVKADTRTWGAEANVRHHTYALIATRNEALAGFRYIDLRESIRITNQSVFPNGTRLNGLDVFRTSNQFYGGQVGLASRYGGVERGFGLDTITKLALGGIRQRAENFGNFSRVPVAGPQELFAGGLYARGANAGAFERTETAFAFDLTANLTYNFSPRAKVWGGYSILWLSSVARPGEQINPVINDSTVPFIANPTVNSSTAPAFRWKSNDYWVQGLNFGAGLMY